MEWTNWAGNQRMSSARVVRPVSADSIVSTVKEAAAQGLRVKAIGSGHSFTGIGRTDGVLLDMPLYSRLRQVDAGTKRVTVESGMTVRALNANLREVHLGLTNMGDIDVQTVSGALSTGTHGTGRDSAGFAAQVVELELVLADGSVVICNAHEEPALFDAARVGLGALGIISRITFQAESAFLLQAQERPEPLDEVLEGFFDHVAANDHFEFFWFPHTDVALTKRNNRTQVRAHPLPRWRHLLDDELLSNGLFSLTNRVGRRFPASIPTLNRSAARALSARTYRDLAPAVFTSPRRVKFYEMEYAIPLADLPGVFAELRGLPERLGLTISFPVEVRAAPADDAMLSTAHGRATAYVAVHVYQGTPCDRYFGAVEEICTAVGGRPHWGKLHSQTAESLRRVYPRFEDFLAVRERVDPDRVFTNDYLDRVLGP